ncbi:MAG: Gfo/Idh/MocA family oxidoreductase [candidate division KSB1 bacterium]|nr:Gfo/Idh/MocA family oxidoreductase [candidate division KSB1 bacterium]
MDVSVAVIGAGYWGPNLIRNFATLSGCKLAAVCDLDPRRLVPVAEKYGVYTTTRMEDILRERSIDAVAVATPAETHRHVAEACLQAGKHAFVEKPLARTSAEAEVLIRLAGETSRVLMVGHIFLYDSAICRLIELIRQGEVGKVRYAHGIRTSMAGTARLDTNVVWDALVHDAYVLPALMGRKPRRVLVVGQAYLAAGIEDVVFATFDFGEGVLAQLYVSWYALEKARRLVVVGSEAIAGYDDLAVPKLTLYRRRYERSGEMDAQGRPRWRWRDEGAEPIATEGPEPLRLECAHFVECVRKGDRPRTDGLAGLEALRVLEACQHSLELGGVWKEVA